MQLNRALHRTSRAIPVRALSLALCVVTALAACGDDSSAAPEPPESTTTSTTIPSFPLTARPSLPAGTYQVSSEGQPDDSLPNGRQQWSIVAYTITVPDGWYSDNGHYLSKHEDGEVD